MKRLIIAATAVGLGLSGLGAVSAAAATGTTDTYKPSAISWGACPSDFVSTVASLYDGLSSVKVSTIVKCANLQVPLDYAHPKGKKISLFLTFTPHQGVGKAKGQIVVNPGGPGGAGGLFGPRVFAQNSAPMQAAYDVVGFDPRGVGSSVSALTCDTTYNQAVRPDYGTGDKASEKIWLARSKSYAAKCKAGDKIGLLNHIKTIDSVRDIDTIRAALGDKKLDYYGASYGTTLGSTYATVFPKKVGRMVLDGDVDPTGMWYRDNLDQDVAFDQNIEYYFGWIAKYDSIYHLGTTQKAVHNFYYKTLAELKKHPVYSADKSAAVGPADLPDGVQNAAYRRSKAVWTTYAAGLAAYKAKNWAAFVDTFGAPTKDPVDDNGFAVYNAVQCTDVQWPLSWAKWQRDNDKIQAKHPFLTWSNVWFNAPCLYWPAKAGKPVKVGATKDLPKNILMFEATNDAATPYAGALTLHKILRGSHLVVQDGDRTHCIVHRGSSAVDAYFDAYFLNGSLPSSSTVHVPQLGDPVPSTTAAAKSLSGSLAAAQLSHDVIK